MACCVSRNSPSWPGPAGPVCPRCGCSRQTVDSCVLLEKATDWSDHGADASDFSEKVLLEFPICPFGGPDGELIPQKFKDQTLQPRLVAACEGDGRRELDAESGALFGHGLDGIVGGDDVENEACILDDDAFDADSTHTCAPDHLDFSTMKIGSGQFCGGALSTGIDLGAQYLAHIAEPQIVQRQEGNVCLAVARHLVQAQLAALFSGHRFGLEGPFAVFQLPLALGAAGLFRGGLRWWRCRA